MYRERAQLLELKSRPDESTLLRSHHRLEKRKLTKSILVTVNELVTQRGLLLKVVTTVDATLVAASTSTSTKNKARARDPKIHSNKKSNQWYFAMKAHIGVDPESGLVYTLPSRSRHVSNIAEASSLLHDNERVAFGDAGYQGIEKRPNAKADVIWHVTMRPGKHRALNKKKAADTIIKQAE